MKKRQFSLNKRRKCNEILRCTNTQSIHTNFLWNSKGVIINPVLPEVNHEKIKSKQ